MDDFAVLGVQPGADLPTIRRRYRQLQHENHPDRHGNTKEADERFRQLESAYKRIEKRLQTTELEVGLHVLVYGGVVRYPRQGGGMYRLVVPPMSWVGRELVGHELAGQGGKTNDVVLRVLAPDGWAYDAAKDLLVTDLLVSWLAAYRGDEVAVVTPAGERVSILLAPGSDTGMFVDLAEQGVPGRYGRGPARFHLRLVPPPPGSRAIIDALEAPWG